MKIKSAQYPSYTLTEVLVVLAIVIILGTLAVYAFGGFRDTVLTKESIENIKQDIQLAQQKSMLLEKATDEYWPYGIGLDFSEIEDGKYTFFKWCSEFPEYGHLHTRSQRPFYDPSKSLDAIIVNPDFINAHLPVGSINNTGKCENNGGIPYITRLAGMEETFLKSGFNIALLGTQPYPAYLLFESVTGRTFLYNIAGEPVDGPISVMIERNRGNKADVISITNSGRILQFVLGAQDIVDMPKEELESESGEQIIIPIDDNKSTCLECPPGDNCLTVVCDPVE